jgi:hypothetical protein
LPEVTPSSTLYRLYRVIESRDASGLVTRDEKPVFKPTPDVRLFSPAGTPLAQAYDIDINSGLVFFSIGFVPNITARGSFHLPVRFSGDDFEYGLTTGGLAEAILDTALPLVNGTELTYLVCKPEITRLGLSSLDLIEFTPQTWQPDLLTIPAP